MKEVIEKISKSGFSNENLDAVLKHYFEGRCVVISEHTVNKINIPGLPLELVLLQKENATKSAVQRRYSPTMKQFAHTLYFYSPKAYKFLRQYFTLSNARTLRKWLCNINCQPGILQEVLEFLKEKAKTQSHLKQCALIVDSMSLRKQIIWDQSQGKFTGNVEYGGLVDVDFEMAASEALFFMIVSYTTNFKCPVAYFLVNKLNASLQTFLMESS